MEQATIVRYNEKTAKKINENQISKNVLVKYFLII